MTRAALWEIIILVTSVMTSAFSKASVAFFLLRIMTQKWLRWTLWWYAVSNGILCVITAFLVVLQCHPVHKAWNPMVPGHCFINMVVLGDFGTGTWKHLPPTLRRYLLIPVCFSLQRVVGFSLRRSAMVSNMKIEHETQGETHRGDRAQPWCLVSRLSGPPDVGLSNPTANAPSLCLVLVWLASSELPMSKHCSPKNP